MRRRPKTSDELRTDLKTFEAVWKQEMAKVMRNAVERMIAVRGRTPPRYKMKLPRFLRTVVEPSQKLSVAVHATRPLGPRAPARTNARCPDGRIPSTPAGVGRLPETRRSVFRRPRHFRP